MPYQNVEDCRFSKIDKSVRYKKIIFGDKAVSSKIKDLFSKNLCNTGISFVTKRPPELSSIVVLDIDYKNIPAHEETAARIFILDDKPLGKVVRIETAGNSSYNVGISFIGKSDTLGREIKSLVSRTRIRRFCGYLLKASLALLFIVAVLSVNLIYIEQKETYMPNRQMYVTPANIGIPYEEINFTAKDGQIINGWFIPAGGSKTTILFCPGRNGNLSDQLARIKFFHDMGINLLMFDYRGYGKNSGRPSERGFYRDARAAYDYLVSRKDIDKDRIIIFGESLGGAVAAELCLRKKAQALILESPVVSLPMQARHLYPFLPTDLLLFEKYDTLSKIKDIRIPKLIVHGIDDEKIPFSDAMKLYYAAPSPKEFLPFQGAHNDDIFKISNDYKDQINEFLLDNQISLR